MITISGNGVTLKHENGQWSGEPLRIVAVMRTHYNLATAFVYQNSERKLFEKIKQLFFTLKVEYVE